MKLNNKGFALTSIIYMLIVLFLMVMLLILANLAQRKVVLDKIKNDVKENLNQGGVVASSNMIVTFDPQGGQINQTSKQVTYNEPYGELPTPTKAGYKFVGWRGKNLFDKDSIPDKNGYYITSSGSETAYGSYAIYKTSVKPNTQYTITNSGKSNAPGYALYDENNNFITGAGYSNTANVTFTTPSNAAYIRFSVVANQEQNETYRYDKDYFQLEEGSTATSYEPYQEYTSDTIVTKQENHTLYAKWEPLYTVTFDPNGGTITETTKQVEYHQPYGTLPTPTKTGYTFMGWNGKNLFNLNDINVIQQSIITNNNSIILDGSSTNNNQIHQGLLIRKLDSLGNYAYLYSSNSIGYKSYSFTKDTNYGGFQFKIDTTKYDPVFSIFPNIIDNSNYTLSYNIDSYETQNAKITISNVQIEEGDTATEYEPYYITPTTPVVQQKNHTLKAIWKANE